MKWCIVYDDSTKIKEHLTFSPIRCIFIPICLKYTRSEYKQHVIKYEKPSVQLVIAMIQNYACDLS